jgi:ADP-ribose pyrophosphatase
MNNENPWRIKSKKEVYSNNWIEVSHHEVINPSGNDGIYGTVHFKNNAIGIIPLTENLETYLVGQYRFPLNEYCWEIPMGGGLIKTSILDSAKRELEEEVGLLANDWQEILKIHTSNSVCDEVGYVFIAQNLVETTAKPEETELLQVKKLSFNEAFEMVMQNQITDSLSIAGILKTKILLDKGIIQNYTLEKKR